MAKLKNRQLLIDSVLAQQRQEISQEGWFLLIEGEQERQRLAQKLHDGPIQHLIVISYQLTECQKYFNRELLPNLQPGKQTEERSPTLDDIRHEVLGVVRQLRQLVGELHPAGLEKVGLIAAIERYVSRLDCEKVLKIELGTFKIENSYE